MSLLGGRFSLESFPNGNGRVGTFQGAERKFLGVEGRGKENNLSGQCLVEGAGLKRVLPIN